MKNETPDAYIARLNDRAEQNNPNSPSLNIFIVSLQAAAEAK